MPAAEAPRLHLPAGSAADGSDPVLVTPAIAGWAFSGLRVMRLAAGGVACSTRARTRWSCCRSPGPCSVRCRRAALPTGGPALRLRPRHRLRLRAPRRAVRGRERRAAASSRCPARGAPAPAGARLRAGGARAGRDPRRGRRHAPGHELLHAGHLRRRPPERRSSSSPRRATGRPTRPTSTTRRARARRSSRRSTTSACAARTVSACTAPTRGRRLRRHGHRRRRRRVPGAARLSRALRGQRPTTTCTT